nr:hypothetical protein BaRGS_022865 [Batillaria attramentaria]
MHGGCGDTVYSKVKPYKGHETVPAMQKALSEVCRDQIFSRIKESPFIGLMLDESLDVAVNKKLVIFCRISCHGEAKIEFAANVTARDGKAATIMAAILSFLRTNGIGLDKVSGVGTDGANVMVGRQNCVGVQLQRMNGRIVATWCVAHRLALVAHWAAKTIDYLQTIQATLIAVYKFFQYSATRYLKIRELSQVMRAKVKRFKKPTQVRWLSLQDSILALHSAWGCLVLALGQEAAATQTEGAAQAKGILKVVKTAKFLGSLCMLADVLGCICTCNVVFQKDILDVHEIADMLASTQLSLDDMVTNPGHYLQDFLTQLERGGQFQGIPLQLTDANLQQIKSLQTRFTDNIKREIAKRFPKEDMQVQKDLAKVLDPQVLPARNDGLQAHGQDELRRLLNRYAEPGSGTGIDAVRAMQRFQQYKFYLTQHRAKTLPAMCKELIKKPHLFPDFSILAHISVTLPVSSVPCERGFSSQNSTHTTHRSCLKTSSVERKMWIKHEAKQDDFQEDQVIEKACTNFHTQRQRQNRKVVH